MSDQPGNGESGTKIFLPDVQKGSDGSTTPNKKPTPQPTTEPTSQPTSKPTTRPTSQPTSRPTSQPTSQPTSKPTSQPTSQPTAQPTSTTPPTGNQVVVIDPVTRIEGHLRLEVKVSNGAIQDAWSTGTMFRGLETILKGRNPREAWMLTQRICGVCTTVHAIASVRAVENALGIVIPENANLLRNLVEAAQFVHDHVIHFYHLHALDWVDLLGALNADPTATSNLAKSLSDWPNSSPDYFQSVKTRLQNFVNQGQLGLFGNGYWGHPAYKLPAEGNLLAVAHYLEALEWQQQYIRIHARLGGKNPHAENYLVGGMAVPLDPSNTASITPQTITDLRAIVQNGLDFVSKVYLPDMRLIMSYYKDWANVGGGYGNFLSVGDFPSNPNGDPASLYLPRGIVMNRAIGSAPQSVDQQLIQEYVTHSWFSYPEGDGASKHPFQGVTNVNYTGPQQQYSYLNDQQKYSWLKSPRYNGAPMEVGPLARVVVAYAAGHARIRQLTDAFLSSLGLTQQALFSTLGRIAARAIETEAIAEQMKGWLDKLESNIRAGNLTVHNSSKWSPSTWPAQASGYGFTEAPRGALGHWVSIQNGQISSYQAVVPTTWNGSPRDAQNNRGPWEQALVGIPVADGARPLEVLRTIHSFDPCMACAVHIVDTESNEVTRVYVEHY